MKTITVNAFTFDELSDKAKDKARQWMREGIDVDEWSDQVTEDAAQVGVKITGFDVGRGNDIQGTVDQPETTAHKILKDHGDMCNTHKTASDYLSERDTLLTQWPRDENGEFENEGDLDDKLDEIDADFTKSILEDYLADLRSAYEYAYSDEAVDETIEANEYLFTEDGSRTTVL